MEIIINIFSNWQVVGWLITGLLVLAVLIYVLATWNKKKKYIIGVITIDNMIASQLFPDSDPISYYLTPEFMSQCKHLFIMYYNNLKMMDYCGKIDGNVVHGFVLKDSGQLNYKFYVDFDVYPCEIGTQLKGYIRDGIFHVIGYVDEMINDDVLNTHVDDEYECRT